MDKLLERAVRWTKHGGDSVLTYFGWTVEMTRVEMTAVGLGSLLKKTCYISSILCGVYFKELKVTSQDKVT